MQKAEEYIVLIHKAGALIGAYTAKQAHDYLSNVLTPSTTLPIEVPPVIVTPEPEPIPAPDPEPVKPEAPKVKDVTGKVGESFFVQLPDFGTPYDISDLPPGGLRWDGGTRTISGVPRQADSRVVSLKNASGVLATFTLTIAGNEVTPDRPDAPATDSTITNVIRDYKQIDKIQ